GTKTHWIKVNVHATEGVQGEVARIERGTFSDIVMRATSESENAEALLRFARFPAYHAESKQNGYRVLVLDFRFYDNNDKTALGAEILLDRSLNITKEDLSFAEIAK
ncbi:MAG TPA: hypothetical protein VKY31_02475, partial [Terriglobia bacterium]|nr:hypothetical protein [Terriglobia bacterium]